MNFTFLPTDLPHSKQGDACDHLINTKIPNVSLKNQDGNLLKLNRNDTFRLVIYCFPMTGHPERSLPKNWNSIPGAKGCSLQNCSFRDKYDELITCNALPIGISTQSTEDLKEMTSRLHLTHDILSDQQLLLSSKLKLPTFSIAKKIFIKRLTLIVEKSVIKHVFYPIFSPDKHILSVLDWLKKN